MTGPKRESLVVDQRPTIIIASLGGLFFVGLTLYYSLHQRTRHFVPATFVIALGCFSSLTRTILVPSFSRAGGVWRVLTALLLIGGGIMYQRQWNRMKRERGTERSSPDS